MPITNPIVKIKKTKYLVRFLNRLAQFEGDVELVDVFKSAAIDGKLSLSKGAQLFDYVDVKKHPRLAARAPSEHGRKIALAHLKRTLYSSFIKDLYEDFAEYMTSLLAGAARNGLSPERLIGEHKVPITANDVLACGNWNKVVEMISRDLFRQLEQDMKKKGVLKTLSILSAKLDLGVDEKLRDAAVPYLELRHKLVHADGVADDVFCKNFPSLGAIAGQQIRLDYSVYVAARDAVVAMIRNYDECSVRKSLIPEDDLQG